MRNCPLLFVKPVRLLYALALLAELPAPAQQPDTLQYSISTPPTAMQGGAQLGFSVAVDGSYTVVGAPYNDIGAQDAGVAKVFDTASGALLHVIPNPNPSAGDSFGWSVAISGSRVVVGAPYDNAAAGSAFVYDLAGATPTTPVATLNNPGPVTTNERFGAAVAISGTRVVVGTPDDDWNADAAGSAYVYDLAGATPTTPVATLNNPTPMLQEQFGFSVAISGTRVVVGDPYDDTGAPGAGSAYVYDLSSATATMPVVTLNHPSPAVELFGTSVAISGTRVAVGAPSDDPGYAGSAYVYDLAGAIPTVPMQTLNNPDPDPTANDQFGISVAISGTRIVVGAYLNDAGAGQAGSTYVYDLAATTPSVPVHTLNNPDPAANDQFGTSVAISGTRVVVGANGDDTGAPDAGSAYVYELVGATPTTPVATLNNPDSAVNEQFGYSVAISGTRVVVGAYLDDTGVVDSGSAYVYDLASATPTVPVATLNNPGPGFGDYFGYSVAISGTRVVVGTPFDSAGALYSGSVYVYDLASATPTVPVATLNNPGPASNDQFGKSVAISGTRVVAGALNDDTGAPDAGSAYVYDLAGATPTVPVVTLNNPGPRTGEWFGASVAISGTRAVVGAYRDGASLAGGAYVYDLAGVAPTVPVATLNNPGPTPQDEFGYSVAISGTRVVVGAYSDNTGAANAGSAYVYDLSSPTPTVPVATLNNPNSAINDNFGYSVAIDGATAVIGTPLDDSVAFNKGSAYVFTPANPDFDGDGLLDIWEYARFGSISAHTALDDTDRDGRNELLELAFNADPTVSDLWAAPAVTREGGFLTLTINKRAGVSYLVETAGNPDDGAFSATTTTTLINNATTLKVRDNFSTTTAAERLIRVKVNAAP